MNKHTVETDKCANRMLRPIGKCFTMGFGYVDAVRGKCSMVVRWMDDETDT